MNELKVDDVIAEARRQSGCQNFGDERFLEPLTVLVNAINREAGLSEKGLAAQRDDILTSLVNRLRAQAFFERHPEIDDQSIEAPVIIVGLQRSGTSKLFRLIAADPQWIRLYTWQALNPVPLAMERSGADDPRIAFAENWVKQMQWMQPAHKLDARAPEMEALLLRQTFMINSPARIVPSHQRWCETADYRPVYEFLRQQLKFLQWQTNSPPGKRWILKSPPHLPNLKALAAVFPDATLVMTHRHPKASVGSMLRLVELAQQNGALSVDRERIRDAWLRILSLGIERFLQFVDGGEARKLVHVGYKEIVGDAAAAARRIYEASQAPFTAGAEQAISAWERENPQHKEGAFDYALEDYGLSELDVERQFAPYIRRYSSMF